MLILFWTHALAAAAFAGLLIWRLVAGQQLFGQKLLLAAFAMTACWAWLQAVAGDAPLTGLAETARNLVWLAVLHELSDGVRRQQSVRFVYAAVAAVIGLQMLSDAAIFIFGADVPRDATIVLRIAAAAGGLVLVHNLYGQAAPSSRPAIRLAMLGLAILWIYELNLYTLAWLGAPLTLALVEWRGLAVALSAPLFALAAKREDGWRVQLSRAATFQSLSLLALCAYFALMTLLVTALRGVDFIWLRGMLIAALAILTVGAMAVLTSARARGWAKLKLAKHLFEHRYDYRAEWLRFTETLGHDGEGERPLGKRMIKAFADIVDAPGGLLVAADETGALIVADSWCWPDSHPLAADIDASRRFWDALGDYQRILELDGLRGGWAHNRDRSLPVPAWMIDDRRIWVGIPLIHGTRLVGLLLLAAPDHRRALDWEDFDLLRTAGRQAASSLAEAHGQEALASAQRFEDFNRRFAFILHDVKNLTSQLSLLSRNAERHADNAEFRADMLATLRGSVTKMTDLLARLSPGSATAPLAPVDQPLRDLLAAAVAGRREGHDIRLSGDSSLVARFDSAALQQALGHLIQNAIDASDASQPITVRVSRRDREVSIAVSDKGIGMDGAFVRNRLFQPFASTKQGGFGIGCYEARALVSAMGGRLTVDSQPGAGTTFTLFLPAAGQVSGNQRKCA